MLAQKMAPASWTQSQKSPGQSYLPSEQNTKSSSLIYTSHTTATFKKIKTKQTGVQLLLTGKKRNISFHAFWKVLRYNDRHLIAGAVNRKTAGQIQTTSYFWPDCKIFLFTYHCYCSVEKCFSGVWTFTDQEIWTFTKNNWLPLPYRNPDNPSRVLG